MAQVIIFTGVSRTDPGKSFEVQDQAAAALSRPLGAYQIASILRDHGYTVQVIDRWHWMIRNKGADFFNEIIRKYIGKDTLWIGWSNTFWEGKPRKLGQLENSYIHPSSEAMGVTHLAFDAFNRYRETSNPNIKFVVGGARTWRWSQQDFKFFDFYVEGYSDVMALELTNWLAGTGSAPPIITNDNGLKIINYDKKGDKFDFVNHVHKWHESDHIEYGEALPIEISRGCIFRCSYCSFPLNGKNKLDYMRDPGCLREEFIRNYELYNTTKYYYSDDTHNDSMQKLEFLYNEVYSKLPFKIQFATYLRLDLLCAHPQSIPLLQESGLVGTFFGIESFNNLANKSIGKGASAEKIYDNLWKCKEVWGDQVHIQAGLILGLSNDNEESIMEWGTKAISADSPIDWATITELHLFPKYGKDKYWLNKMELNPDQYGYKFDQDGVNWTNNKGLTKHRAEELVQVLNKEMYKNKWKTAQPKGWYSFIHAANVNMDLDDYLNTYPPQIVSTRDTILHGYYEKLKNGAL